MAKPSSSASSSSYSTSTPLPDQFVRKKGEMPKLTLAPTILIDCAQSKGYPKYLIEKAFQQYNPFAFQTEEQFIEKLRLIQSNEPSSSAITIVSKKKNSAQPEFSPSVQEPLSKKMNLNTSDRYKPRMLSQLVTEPDDVLIIDSGDNSVILLSSSSSEASTPEKPKFQNESMKASIYEAVQRMSKTFDIVKPIEIDKKIAEEQINKKESERQQTPAPTTSLGTPKMIKKQVCTPDVPREPESALSNPPQQNLRVILQNVKQANQQPVKEIRTVQKIVEKTSEKKPEPVRTTEQKEIITSVDKPKPAPISRPENNYHRQVSDENKQKPDLKASIPFESVTIKPPPAPAQANKVYKKPSQKNSKHPTEPLRTIQNKPSSVVKEANKDELPLLDCLLKQMNSDPILAGSKTESSFKIPCKKPLIANQPGPPPFNSSVNKVNQHDVKEKPKIKPLMQIDRDISEPRVTNKSNTGPRFIAIDGSNVAREHGKSMGLKAFSCTGIKIVVDYFLNRGHTQVKAVVPRFRRGKSDQSCPSLNPEVLDALENAGHLTYTPSRYIEGQGMVVPYDDRFIIEIATHFNGVIVSNDNYRDLQQENSKWKTFIQRNLLQFSFVGDLFIVPSDPFGRKGPDIDEFLGSSNNQAPPPPSSSDNNHVSRIRSFNKSEPDKHGKRRPFSENRRPFRSNSRRPGNGRH